MPQISMRDLGKVPSSDRRLRSKPSPFGQPAGLSLLRLHHCRSTLARTETGIIATVGCGMLCCRANLEPPFIQQKSDLVNEELQVTLQDTYGNG